jgi:hypothetical protein
MNICCKECGCYDECNSDKGIKKRGAKIKYDDPIHEAWRLSSRDRYIKMKTKKVEENK